MNPVEREVVGRAFNYECPLCGSGPGKRCKALYANGKRVQSGMLLSTPHPERVTLAWREWLADQHGVQS